MNIARSVTFVMMKLYRRVGTTVPRNTDVEIRRRNNKNFCYKYIYISIEIVGRLLITTFMIKKNTPSKTLTT